MILAALALATIARLSPLGAVEFVGVPESCERRLLTQVGPDLAAVVDWRPWADHLRELGYAEVMVERIMRRTGVELGGTAFLHDLPSWAARREPLGAAGVAQFFLGPGGRRLYRKDAKFLMQRAPLWLDAEDELGLARRAIVILEDRDVARAFLALEARLATGPRADLARALLEHVERRLGDARRPAERLLLHAMTVIPWHELGPRVREELSTRFVDLDAYPPWKTNRIRPRGFGLVEADNCAKMSDGHFRITGVIPNEMHERPERFVRVDGRLVGVLKGEPYGERSMIALRNVVDERGRLVLALGAAYELPYEVIARAGGPILDVERLEVGPVDFVLNQNAWKFPIMSALVAGSVALPFDFGATSREGLSSTYVGRAQAEVLRRLTRFLTETEAALAARW